MGITVAGGEGTDSGGTLGGLRPWLRLFLSISGGGLAIACTLGLLVLLTSAAAQAQPARAVEHLRVALPDGSWCPRSGTDYDPSWQPPSMHQGILLAQGSFELAGEVDAETACDIAREAAPDAEDEAAGGPAGGAAGDASIHRDAPAAAGAGPAAGR